MKIENIQKKYGKNAVLNGVTFEATEGLCVGILGGNGSGKSTLFSILAGVSKPNGGKFLYDGVDLLKNSKKKEELVGYVPQSTPLIEELTAYDNLRLWYEKDDMEKALNTGVLAMLGIKEFLKVPV